jgi:hypothetical protein
MALDMAEQTSVMQALYILLNTYDANFPVKFDTVDSDGSSIGLFSLHGSEYLKHTIIGGFEAFLPFMIVYRGQPKNDTLKINMIDYVHDLSLWLISTEYPPLTDNRVINKIETMSVPYLSEADNSGNITYKQIFKLTYKKTM